jgi:hypothetical protein
MMTELERQLLALRDRIDEVYGNQIDTAPSMRQVDRLLETAIEMTTTIDRVIGYVKKFENEPST